MEPRRELLSEVPAEIVDVSSDHREASRIDEPGRSRRMRMLAKHSRRFSDRVSGLGRPARAPAKHHVGEMIDLGLKSFAAPDQTIELPLLRAQIVELGDFTVGYVVHQPGWSWSEHVRPSVGGEWCQAHHVGVLLSGRTAVRLADGRSYEIAPLEVVDIPPGHDGWVIGDEPAVMLEWAGLHTFAGPALSRGRTLATLLFTDLVDSTPTAARLGDRDWRELLAGHFSAARSALDRFGGREIATTGDGILATFDGPANALGAAEAIRDAATRHGLRVRAGVHVGEVEFAGGDVRGVTVHEAARIMGKAAAGEILVSEATRALAQPSGFAFDDRGPHTLRGLEGERRLYALLANGGANAR